MILKSQQNRIELVTRPGNLQLGYFDYGFTAIFAVEVLLKIIDYGLILHPGSYLRELWNAMDMLVVSCAITSFAMDMM